MVAAIFVATWAADGWGQPVPGIDLRWTGPASCPDAAYVRERVQRLLATATESRSDRIEADGDVVEVGSRYRLTLTLRSHGTLLGKARSFDSDSCESLAGAAAVTIAMLIRTGADSPSKTNLSGSERSSETSSPASGIAPRAAANEGGERSVPTKAGAPVSASTTSGAAGTEVAAASAPDRSSTARAAPPPRERSWHLVFTAPIFWLDAGVLPSLSYGFGAGVGVRSGPIDVGLEFRFSFPQSSSFGNYSSDSERRGGAASGCYEWRAGPVGLAPCLRLSVDDVIVRGAGPYVISSSDEVPWVSAGLSARARWSIGGFAAIFVSPGFALALSQPSFVINDVGTIYQAPLLAFATSFGCEWIW